MIVCVVLCCGVLCCVVFARVVGVGVGVGVGGTSHFWTFTFGKTRHHTHGVFVVCCVVLPSLYCPLSSLPSILCALYPLSSNRCPLSSAVCGLVGGPKLESSKV